MAFRRALLLALVASSALAADPYRPLLADVRVKSALQYLRDDDERTLREQI